MWVVTINMSTKIVESCSQYLNGFADLDTDKIELTQVKSGCPLPFLPSEFSKFLSRPWAPAPRMITRRFVAPPSAASFMTRGLLEVLWFAQARFKSLVCHRLHGRRFKSLVCHILHGRRIWIESCLPASLSSQPCQLIWTCLPANHFAFFFCISDGSTGKACRGQDVKNLMLHTCAARINDRI